MDILNDVFRENPITLNFSFSVVNIITVKCIMHIIIQEVCTKYLCCVFVSQNADVVTKYAGAFWNFSDPYVD